MLYHHPEFPSLGPGLPKGCGGFETVKGLTGVAGTLSSALPRQLFSLSLALTR